METIGQRILRALKELDIPQAELARRIGKLPGYVSRLINEDRKPRADTLQSIAKALGVSMAWLASGEGPARPDGTSPPEMTHKPIKNEPPPTSTSTVIEREDRYPNRAIAIRDARAFGVPEDVLATVASMNLESKKDLLYDDWQEEIRIEQIRRKKGIVSQVHTHEDEPGSSGDITKDSLARLALIRAQRAGQE